MKTTVESLIELLKGFPADWPVVATWEGQIKEIAIYAGKDCLVIDADSEFYRDGLEHTLTREELRVWFFVE